ncbi:MAG: murein biosynthesis integral membrane protein MurJ [Deltaproteobacteria bacterium]|nr:murein biosynthesis integral membrane protein MurJ [Deltaproteobacteria bacterium]
MELQKHTVSEKEKLNQAAGTVGFYTFLSRILGLVRDVVVARFFGAGLAADAFFVAFRIPNLLRRFFAEGSLTIAFIPVFTEYLTQKSRQDAIQMARAALALLTLILALVTISGVLLSPWIVRIQAFGFGGSGIKYELTVLLTRITFPYIFLVSLVAFFMGILNSLRHFAAPAAAPIFLNLGIIGATYWLSPLFEEPVVGVAIGVIIGGLLQVALQIPWLVKKGVSLVPYWMPGHPAVKRIGLLMLPAIFGSAIYQLNQFIGTLLASFLEEGSISWLYYADRIVEFPLGVFAIAVSTAALPSLAKQAAAGDLADFRDTLSHSLRFVFFITFPCMAGMIILRDPIIRLFFQRGAFDALSSEMTAIALLFYSLGLWAFSANRVIVSAFYALQDTKTPVKVAAFAMAANGAFSLLLMGPLKHGGLALALSLASTLQFFLLLLILSKRGSILELKPVLQTVLKSLTASLVMGLSVSYLNKHWLMNEGTVSFLKAAAGLALTIVIGSAIYFTAAAFLRCSELVFVTALLRRAMQRFKRKKAGP